MKNIEFNTKDLLWCAVVVLLLIVVFRNGGASKKEVEYEKEISKFAEREEKLMEENNIIADSLKASKEQIKVLTRINNLGQEQLLKLIKYEREVNKKRKKVWNYSDAQLDSFYHNWFALPDSAITRSNVLQ